MCGILAAIGSINKLITLKEFHEALLLQSHRGPDNANVDDFYDNKVGHTRLSIMDLSTAGYQPMYSKNKDVVIIFNGEIYNFQELKKELISQGISFTSKSDTEVLLKIYLQYGIDAIHRLIGMFAFIIIDKRINHNCTYVVRDRLGIKPLFYFKNNNGYILSSEIKSILALAKQKFNLNKRTVSSYFSYRYSILNETFFEGIQSLTPGSYLKISNNGTSQHKYWQLSDYVTQQDDKGEKYYLNRIDELLHSAIKYQMISDVPFGAYLSGGVDSSLVTAIMSNYSDFPLKTYTIGFLEDQYNEFKFSNCISKIYATEHKAISINENDYFKNLNRLIAYKDAPLSVPNEVPLYLMSKELKKDITVVLSGEGADEIFGGYGRIFRSDHDFKKQTKLKIIKTSAKRFKKKYGTNIFANNLDHFIYNYSYTKPDLKQKLLSKNINWQEIEYSLNKKFSDSFAEVNCNDYQTKMMYTFETIHLQGLLSRVDAMTMATSVEARVPFVDHRLVEFAFSIPNKYKLKWNSDIDKIKARYKLSDQISEVYDTPKYILKKLGEKYLPNCILYRKKMGFPVPLDKWLGGNFAEKAKLIIADKNNIANQVINTDFILSILKHNNIKNDYNLATTAWMVMNLFSFCNIYNKNIIK